MTWLRPVQEALERRARPLTVFFRDDDAGWDDAALFALLDVFEARGTPIDLAVIPTELDERLAGVLFERADGGLLGLHQHGWSHANHEPQGRKCEFGASRPRAAQHDDVRRGHDRLRALLGERLDPIFTPPWNRCTDSTAECLVELGLRVLSRDTTARPFGRADLAEVPVTLDWFKSYRPGMTVSDGCAAELSAQIERGSTAPIGIMTHHGVTDAANRQLIGELLDVLRTCPLVTCRRLIDTLTVRVMPR